MTKANDLASLLDANGDVVSSALDNVPAAPTPSLSSLGIPNHDDVTVDASGNVGIGTNSPSGTLTVEGDIRTTHSSGDTIVLNHDGANGSISNFGGDFLLYATGAQAMVAHTNGTERLRIDSSGSVGIGTASPETVLHTQTSSGDTAIFNNSVPGLGIVTSRNTSTSGIPGLALRSWSTWTSPKDTGQIRFDGLTSTGAYTEYGGIYLSSSTNTSTGAASTMKFNTSDGTAPATERMRIDGATGNVGIGGSPTENLEVFGAATNGTAKIGQLMFKNSSGNYAASTDGVHIFPFSDGNMYINNFDGGFVFRTGANVEKMRIDSSGNLCIGSSSSLEKLRVSGNIEVYNDDIDGYIWFHDNGTRSWSVGSDQSTGNFAITNQSNLASGHTLEISGSGLVGIGTSSPSELLHIRNASGDAAVRIQGNTRTFNIQQNNYGLRFVDVDAGSVERMRIDAGGRLLLNATVNNVAGSSARSQIRYSKTGEFGLHIRPYDNDTGGGQPVLFQNYAGGTIGSISATASATSYNTSSDYRLKTAVKYDWDATTRLKQLKPARFEWIADGDDAVPVDGFLAHEVQDVVPEAILGTKDGMRDEEYEVTPAVLDEDGNEVTPAVMGTRSVPDYQGIDQSKLTPLLTKALIEAVEKIEQLEARITALETVE